MLGHKYNQLVVVLNVPTTTSWLAVAYLCWYSEPQESHPPPLRMKAAKPSKFIYENLKEYNIYNNEYNSTSNK